MVNMYADVQEKILSSLML